MPSYSGYRQNYSDLFFTPEYNQYVAPVDLAEYAKTFDTLQQRHDNAIALESKYKEELSKLDLNPAESGFISNLASSLSSELDANSNYGNLGFGINNMIRRYGNIMFNQGLQGRLDAQRDWKAYNANLEANQTLDEDTKAYYREKNKYYYNPRFDENGNELKGEAWQPIERETDTVDTGRLMIQAMQIAAKDSGGGDTVYFKDANGQWTTNIDASADGMPYYKISGKYEKLTKEKLKAAYDAVIANTPGAMASLEQDYKVQNWKYNKNGDVGVSPVTDEKGVKLNFNQYLDKRFNGFYQSATYTNYSSTFTPLTGLSLEAKLAQQAAKVSNSGGSGDFANAIANTYNVTPGQYFVKRDQALQGAIGQKSASLERLNAFAKNIGLNFDINNADTSFDKIIKYYKDNKQVIPNELYDAYQTYVDSMDKITQIIPDGLSSDYMQRLEASAALSIGADLSTLRDENGNLNIYIERFSKYINDLYGDSDEFVVPIYGDDIVKFIRENPGYEEEYGIKIKYDGQTKSLVLPKENAQNLYKIASVLQNYVKDWRFSVTGAKPVYNARKLYEIRNLYEDINKPVQELSLEQTLIPTNNVSIGDIAETWAVNLVNSGKFSDIKAARESIQNQLWGSLISGINNSYGARINLGYGVDNSPMNYATTGDQREALLRLLQLAISSDKENVGINVDKNTFNTTGTITFSDQMLKDEHFKNLMEKAGIDKNAISVRFIADNLFNNQIKNQLLKDPNYGGKLQFYEDKAAGVREFSSPIGTTITTDGTNYLYNDGFGTYQITESQASDIYTAKQMFHELVKTYGNILIATGSDNLPAQYAQSFSNIILDLVRRYSPQDANVANVANLSPTGRLLYEKTANELDKYVSKYYK